MGQSRISFFLNNHTTASASLLASRGFRGKEPEKVFIASINVFIEKCLCDLPNKPLVYDKEGKNPSKAKLREESTSYLGIGYLQLGTPTFLILYDGNNILAKSYEDDYANLIVLGARAR